MDIIKSITLLMLLILSASLQFDIELGQQEIPITAQSFVVLLIGYFLSIRNVIFVLLTYYTLGALGLGVFANGSGGLEVLTGKSSGFLFGFLVAAIYISYYEFNKNRSLNAVLTSFVVGHIIILAIGAGWLSLDIGFKNTIYYGIKPFIPGAVIKILAATFLVYLTRELTKQKIFSSK